MGYAAARVDENSGFLTHQREDGFNSERKLQFLEAIENNPFHSGVIEACEKLGISKQTYYVHLDKDLKFREQVDRLKRQFSHQVEGVLVSDALKSGKTLAQFGILKAYMPEKYARQENVQAQTEITITFGSMEKVKEESVIDAEVVKTEAIDNQSK